jgi:hypothetical protein
MPTGGNTMAKRSIGVPRRTVLRCLAAGAAVTTITRPAFAVPETIKIGMVAPQTGPFAAAPVFRTVG